jgi:hypothetical protein
MPGLFIQYSLLGINFLQDFTFGILKLMVCSVKTTSVYYLFALVFTNICGRLFGSGNLCMPSTFGFMFIYRT